MPEKSRCAVSRRRFIESVGASLTAPALLQGASRPNILWLIGEDLCPDLGCYGNKVIRTPNLDRLAAEGMRFDNAYVTGPICSPSRSAIMTGMWQIAIDGQNHRAHRTDGYHLPEGVKPFTHYLREAGYHTTNVTTPAKGVKGAGKTDYNFNLDAPPFDGTDWRQRAPGQPFYAQINFHEAHRVWTRDPLHPVDPNKITPPPYYPNVPAVREDWAMYYDSIQQLDTAIGKVLERLHNERLMDNTIIAFFGDNGRAMPRGKEYLYEGGIATPFIVWVPKQLPVEGASRGVVRKELVSCIDLTATTLELAGIRTPSHMHGVPFLGPNRQTRSVVFAARDRGDETRDRIRSVRDARFKYIRNYRPDVPYTAENADRDVEIPTRRVMRQMQANEPFQKGWLNELQAKFMASRKPAEEFFDLAADPYETVNLVDSADHAEALNSLRAALDKWIQETGDTGAIPEKRSAIQRPNEIENRVQVDGWCTHNYSDCVLSRTPISMHVRCGGKVNPVRRSIVTEGGRMQLRFSARARGAVLKTFAWGAITDFDNPKNMRPVEFIADGEPHEYTVEFPVEGHLAKLSFDFGPGAGEADFEWIGLYRRQQNRDELIKEWRFDAA
ncbi:MAG TPA: sulfatase [Bryobacteraceae bacterium]|nr:sulfatase [Bryobacteraceae bacterium]